MGAKLRIISDRFCQFLCIGSVVAMWFGWEPTDRQLWSTAFVGAGMAFSAHARISDAAQAAKR
jgi:uncharacterized protein YfiM (DUF2279 family)